MCGIAGIKRFGEVGITEEELSILLCSLENRGNHATGIAIQNDDSPTEVFVYKKDLPAWSFIASDEYLAFIKDHLNPTTRTVLLHTRAATVGAPYKSENNHPMFMGNTAVVHNGGISNSDALFTRYKFKKSCETDSDVIRALLDDSGFTREGVRRLSEMSGSAAIAAVRADAPNTLLLARSGNPIVYADFKDKLYWASETQAIQKAVRPWVKRHGLFMRESASETAYFAMPDNTAYLIGPEGVEWKEEMKVAVSFRPAIYRMHENYHTKQRMWKFDKEREKRANTTTVVESSVMHCPVCHARCHKTKPADPWSSYLCHKCDTPLGKEETSVA